MKRDLTNPTTSSWPWTHIFKSFFRKTGRKDLEEVIWDSGSGTYVTKDEAFIIKNKEMADKYFFETNKFV